MIKSSPNFKEFTADEIFDTFNTSQLTGTVFMDRDECKESRCGMGEFTDLMYDIVPTYLGLQTPDDVREVCRRAKNPKAKAFLEAFETALENAKFTDKFYDSIKIHKKGEIASSSWKKLMDDSDWDYGNPESYEVWDDDFGVSFKTTDKQEAEEFYNTHPESLYLIEYLEHGNRIIKSKENNMIKSAHTRPDSERFDEYGYFNPYTPTEEELAKKDEIKKVLSEELSKAYEPDPMDDYVGYDSTNERIDMACERVAKQFNVDTDFVDELAGEVQKEENARQYEEAKWAEKNLKGDEYDKWYRGELDIRPLMLKNSRQIKSSFISSSLSDILQDKEALQYFTVEELQKMNYNEWLLKKITADEHTENDSLIAKLYKEHLLKSSRQIKSSTVTSDKRYRLIDTEHEDPKDGEDFTAEELRNYISENDEYFDNVGLDYTIVDLNTGEEMNISTFRLNSSFIKSSKYIVEVGDDSVEFDNLKEANETFRQAVENNDPNTTIKIYVDEGYSNKHLKLMDSERGRLNSSIIKSSYEDAFTVHPWDRNQVTGTSDEDLGLSYVVEAYGNEFVNVDDETLNDIRDEVLLRYFDDDAYVRDWNINYPDNQIESIYDIEDPEDLNNEELARYFDYEAYGRDLRLNNNMVWDSEEECWVSAHDVDDNELDNDKYIFMRG